MQAPQDRQPRAIIWRPLTRMESGDFYNVSCKKKKEWPVLSELEMRHQVPLEARDMNGPLGLRPSSPLLDRWSWAWARDLPLRAWSGGRFFCRELLTSLIRLCPKLACLCPHLFRLRGREVATESESLWMIAVARPQSQPFENPREASRQ